MRLRRLGELGAPQPGQAEAEVTAAQLEQLAAVEAALDL